MISHADRIHRRRFARDLPRPDTDGFAVVLSVCIGVAFAAALGTELTR